MVNVTDIVQLIRETLEKKEYTYVFIIVNKTSRQYSNTLLTILPNSVHDIFYFLLNPLRPSSFT